MPRLRLSSNPNSVHRVQLYKKQPAASKPCCIRDSAICTHLIHRPVHSLWGQVEKRKATAYKAFSQLLSVFYLTGTQAACRRPKKVRRQATKGIARGQSLRHSGRSFQSLTTDLSTGRSGFFKAVFLSTKLLTNRPCGQPKEADQKTVTPLHAL